MPKFEVEVYGYCSAFFVADNKAKARYRAFLAFRDVFGSGITFHNFLARGVTVTEVEEVR